MSAGSVDEATVNITDTDVPDVKVSFGAAAYTAAEGGTATITVDPGRGARATGGGAAEQDQPGRSIGRRLLRRAGQRDLRQQRHFQDVYILGNR